MGDNMCSNNIGFKISRSQFEKLLFSVLFSLSLSGTCLNSYDGNERQQFNQNSTNWRFDPKIEKLLSDEKEIASLISKIKLKILLLCNLPEKMELLGFLKNEDIFRKIAPEIIINLCNLIGINQEYIFNFAINPGTPLTSATKEKGITQEAKNLSYKILKKIDTKTTVILPKIISFLNIPNSANINASTLQCILEQTLDSLSNEELKIIENLTNSGAFLKISNNIDKLIDQTIEIVKTIKK